DPNLRFGPRLASCQEHDVIVECDLIAKHNVARISGDLDRLKPAATPDLNAAQAKPKAAPASSHAHPNLKCGFKHASVRAKLFALAGSAKYWSLHEGGSSVCRVRHPE